MSHYTSIILHPVDAAFQPSERFVKGVLEFFGISQIRIASGSRPAEDDDEDEEEIDLFSLKNINLEEAFAAKRDSDAVTLHLILPFEGVLRAFSDSVSTTIPQDMAGDFLPWATGITIGKWNVRDYNTDKVVAFGNFCITKSGNGCPPSLVAYLDRIKENPELQKLTAFLESKTGCKWKTSIQLT